MNPAVSNVGIQHDQENCRKCPETSQDNTPSSLKEQSRFVLLKIIKPI